MACSKENSDQTLRKSSSREGWAKPESGCLGKFWTPQPCRYSRLDKVQRSWSCFAVRLCFEEGVGGDDVQRCPPASFVVLFCEMPT